MELMDYTQSDYDEMDYDEIDKNRLSILKDEILELRNILSDISILEDEVITDKEKMIIIQYFEKRLVEYMKRYSVMVTTTSI